MPIFQVATELAAVAKVGGLADVVYGLSKALIAKGNRVKILLPYYDTVNKDQLSSFKTLFKDNFHIASRESVAVEYLETHFENLSIIFVKAEDRTNAFRRGCIYGQPDDPYRFLLFLYLVKHYFEKCEKPSLIHLHDWPTAFLSYIYKSELLENSPLDPKIVFTIHNMLHQGRTTRTPFEALGIETSHLFSNEKLIDPNNSDFINLLKCGISYSDNITTVSPTYSKEIQTEEFGFSLSSALKIRKNSVTGILNGIDLDYWNPTKDPALARTFPNSFHFEKVLKAKKANREHIQKLFNLKETNAPLFCTISRLDFQKNPVLIEHAATYSLEKGAQFFLLGTATDPTIEMQFDFLKEKYKKNPYFCISKLFDENLARLLYAAADFIVIPSNFEPCGLTQMIAMRYYCIPIVRKTGGLSDSVTDIVDQNGKLDSNGVGIVFDSKKHIDLEHAIERALALHFDTQAYKEVLAKHSLQDFSWRKSAEAYLDVYKKKL